MSSNKHNHTTRLKTGAIKRKIIKYSDDSSDNSDIESDDNSDLDNDELFYYDNNISNDITNDKLNYYKFLNKLFPSNYSETKIKNLKRQRLLYNVENKNVLDDINNEIIDKPNNQEKFNKNYVKHNNFNIILNMNNDDYYKQDDDIIELNNEDDYTDDEYDDCEEDGEYSDEEDDEDSNLSRRKQAAKILYNIIKKKYQKINDEDENEDEDDEDRDEDIEFKDEYEDNNKVKNKLKNKIKNDDKETDNMVPAPKNISTKNYRKFNKILQEDNKESLFFKTKLSKVEQEEKINKLEYLKKLSSIETPYLIHLLELDIPDIYKACALRKINMLRAMSDGYGNSEYYKIKSWVDNFIKIPFNKYNNLPITFADGIEECHNFMEKAKQVLDSVVFGLNDAKIQIMQLIGLWLVNPNAVGCAIAIKGPMGTGKTTLIKEGISKILNRPFALVALGGCGDSGYLDGHDYTFEGSKSGKIVEILIQSGCMNPVILFDELDKLSDSPKGEEITGVLTHLTDTTQNNKYTDKYLSEISLDMSKALYIFSYNDESKVNSILKDRMYRIETKGYNVKDKITICKNYLIPKICEQTKFEKNDIIFEEFILEYIITYFTDKEQGVRNLKRCIETIYTKLNLYRLMKPDINIFESSLTLKEKISFPINITKQIIDQLINKTRDEIPFGMYN